MKRLATILVLGGALFAPASLAFAGPAAGPGDNVILIVPTKVDVPGALPGDCRVRGVVRAVWDGTAFRVGQAVMITVPCADPTPVFDDRPATGKRRGYGDRRLDAHAAGVNPYVLAASTLGGVHLDDYGRLIWTPSRKSYGNWGHISGYQVGGAKLPLMRNAA